jgi:putative transposase
MKKAKHSEEKIIGAVKQMEAGRSVKELARELGVTDQTLYNWKSKYGGMEVSDAKRLRALEEENRQLKQLVADLSLDKAALTTVVRKKRLELVSVRRDVALVMTENGLSQRHACRLLEVDRTTYRYEPRPDRNAQLRAALIEAARHRPRYGYRRLWVVLTTREGFDASIGRVHRLYREEGLTVRRQKKEAAERNRTGEPIDQPAESGMGTGLRFRRHQ